MNVHFQVDQPESRGILVFILLADVLNTIIREIIIIGTSYSGDTKAGAIATVFFFVFIITVVFGSLVVSNILHHVLKKDVNIGIRMSYLAAQSFGATLYYYGDNIIEIVAPYQKDLSCDPSCIKAFQIYASIASGVALIFYHNVISCMHQFTKLIGHKEKLTTWFSAAGMITVFIKMDSLFNAVVEAAAVIDDYCDPEDVAINTVFMIIIVITGIIFMTVNCFYVLDLLQKSNQQDLNWIIYVTYGLVVVCFPIFMLTDNLQPLDCAFGCDTLERNQTLNNLNCNVRGSSGFRLAFSIIIFIILTLSSSLLFFCRKDKTEEFINKEIS